MSGFFCFGMSSYCYIIYSIALDRYYVGHTGDDLSERIRKHNTNHKGYTGKSDDWELKYWKAFETKTEAHALERKIKSWKSRKKIEELVQSIPT